MRFTILCVGKIKEAYMQSAINDYIKRLSKYAKVTVTEVMEENHPAAERRIEKEGEALLKKITPGSCTIALDLHGKEMTSESFASYFKEKTVSGISEFVFVIGGSDGIDSRITKAADIRLCLSPMTFTHQMTRLILAEQIYRAMKINSGEQYHK